MQAQDQDFPEETFQVADEFLHLLIGILCERMSPEVSEVAVEYELRYRLFHGVSLVTIDIVLDGTP